MAQRQEEERPYRRLASWPTSIFIDTVLNHLRKSASPETCDLLYRNRISKDTKFQS